MTGREYGGFGKWQSYPAYKDSGVEWLGEIPAEWDCVPIKAITRRVKRTNQPKMELLSVYREHGVVPFDSRDDNHNRPSLDLSTYQVVEVGNLVLNKMKTWQGSLAISEYEGLVSPAYIVCRLSEGLHPKFIHHLLRSTAYIAQYLRNSYGVRVGQWDMRYEDFRMIEALIPPLPEQRAIAAFLDRETARIDALIAAKERLIDLLGEKRAALISHAVTKGLDPDVPMRDSGVEWLGEIPEHWEVKRIGYISESLQTGPFGSQLHSDDYVSDGVPVINPSHLKNGFIEADFHCAVGESD